MANSKPALDETDYRILELLFKDARSSFRDIASSLKVSPSTVFFRVKKLEEQGVLQGFVPVLDFEKLGFGVTVAINVKAKGGKLEEVEKEIARSPNVIAVYDVTGEWDVLVIAKFKNMRELNTFVKKMLSSPHIEHTLTSTVLNRVKENLAAQADLLKERQKGA